MGIELTNAQKAAFRKDASLTQAAGGDAAQWLADLQTQLDALPIAGTILEAAIASGAVALVKLKDEVADLMVLVDWAAPEAEDANTIDVQLQLTDAQGNALEEQHVLELHVSDTTTGGDSATATISAGDGADGDILSGSGTAAVRVKTDANGHVDLKVTETASASRYLICRACYGSPILDARETVTLAFA